MSTDQDVCGDGVRTNESTIGGPLCERMNRFNQRGLNGSMNGSISRLNGSISRLNGSIRRLNLVTPSGRDYATFETSEDMT